MNEINRRAVLIGTAVGFAHPAPAAASVRRGLSLHIGVNELDAGHYKGEFEVLKGAVADALLMGKICTGKQFTTDRLLCEQATRANVIAKVRETARKLQSGDIFVITFAGHGSQLPDLHGDEDDKLDETWCLYDAQIRDDELRELWGEFAAGVRIVVISDSCHSGTVHAIAIGAGAKALVRKAPCLGTSNLAGIRMLPPDTIWATYFAHKQFYDQSDQRSAPPPKCSVISISAAQDYQKAYDGSPNGAFTTVLSTIWNNGSYDGTYRAFTAAIADGLGALPQRPRYEFDGAKNDGFESQQAFFI